MKLLQLIKDFHKWRKHNKEFEIWKHKRLNEIYEEEIELLAYKVLGDFLHNTIMYEEGKHNVRIAKFCLKYGIEHKEEILKKVKI